jgi:2-polyprenyl-3-methyl-5-hydroxy-6-metoxy-1,4-benzoquinol methylase
LKKVLFPRYLNDSKPTVFLDNKRKKIRNIIQEKLNNNSYINETINCHVCDSSYEHHELISSKERHGLELDCVVCKKCGLIFTNPRMSKEAYGHFYTTYYRDLYNYKFGKNNLDTLFYTNYLNGKSVYKFVEPFIKERSNILEIGCANGGLLKFFKEKGHHITGLDLGEAEVIYGRDKHGLNLIHKSIDDFQSETKQDLIIMIHVIEHLTDCAETMHKIYENLSDTGLLYISCPDVDNLINGQIYKSDWLTLMQNAHTINFDKISIENLLAKYGFELHHFEPGMNLVARKKKDSKFIPKLNYPNALKVIEKAEQNYQSRRFQNNFRNFLETKGIFALIVFSVAPINKLLIKLGLQKYIKSLIKFLYKYI